MSATRAALRVGAATTVGTLLSSAVIAVAMLVAGASVFAPGLTGRGVAPYEPAGLLAALLIGICSVWLPAGRSGAPLRALAAGIAMALALPLATAGHADLLQAIVVAGGVALLLPLVPLTVGRYAPVAPERTLILGSGEVARRAADALATAGAELVGWIDDDPLPWEAGPSYLGPTRALGEVVRSERIDRVVVAFSAVPDAHILASLRECDALGVPVTVIPRLFDMLPAGARVSAIGNVAALEIPAVRRSLLAAGLKRVLDIAGAGCLLVLTAPIMAIVAALIALDDGTPVLFRQSRIGRRGRPFHVLKFRTMVRDADARGDARIAGLETGEMALAEAVTALKQANDPRVTRVGRFLRKSSLDELPQLWNVLRGEMSLVGPRPLREFEVARLSGWERSRNDVKPGVTGLWQVSGRSDVDWADRMQLDYRYVRHWTLSQDLRILARTVPAVLGRRGAV